MGVGLIGCGIGCHRDLAGNGVREEVSGNNRGICSGDTNIKPLYSLRLDGGLQYVHKVVRSIPHPQSDILVGRVKERTVTCVKTIGSSYLGFL